MIGPDTYTIVGNGSTFGARNMHEKFLQGMSEHCQSLARIPLLRKDKFESQSHNAFGDQSYDGTIVYQCIDAAHYDKLNYHLDEATPIQRIEKKVIIEHK